MNEHNKLILNQAELLYNAKAICENTLGNSANLIFEVEIEKTPFILRASEYSEKKKSHIEFELNWVNYLAAMIEKYPGEGHIVKPVKSVNHNLYEVIKADDKRYILCLFEKARGKVVDNNDSSEYNEDLFFKLGVLMGKMHRVTSEYDGNIAKPEFEWFNNTFFSEEYNVILDEEVQPFERKYITELHTLPKSKDCYGIIHDDVHIHNFFVDTDNGHIKLFDYDDCHFSWYACDIATALLLMVQCSGAESEESRTEFAETCLLSYLKGYIQENAITEYWIFKIDLFMRYRMTCIYKFVQNNWRNEPVHPHQGYLDWHKHRIVNDLPYVFIDYKKIIGSLPLIVYKEG